MDGFVDAYVFVGPYGTSFCLLSEGLALADLVGMVVG